MNWLLMLKIKFMYWLTSDAKWIEIPTDYPNMFDGVDDSITVNKGLRINKRNQISYLLNEPIPSTDNIICTGLGNHDGRILFTLEGGKYYLELDDPNIKVGRKEIPKEMYDIAKTVDWEGK